MGCLPSNSKCEWMDLKHFVKEYNNENSSTYERTICLDIVDRDNKQPEVLCTDKQNNTLVIERKSFLWPSNYAQIHNCEHTYWKFILEKTTEIISTNFTLYTATPNTLLTTELESLADEISYHISININEMHEGKKIKLPVAIDVVLYKEFENERDYDEPHNTLQIVSQETSISELNDPKNLPIEFHSLIGKLVKSTNEKFKNYDSSRKVLILEYNSAGMYMNCDGRWWEQFLKLSNPNFGTIDELWLSFNYHMDLWNFHCVYNKS